MKLQMKSSETYYIGVDISKDKIDVFTRHDHQVHTIANQLESIDRLIADLAKHGKIHIVCEATGGYEKALLNAAFKADIPISLLNARCVRAFADAMSQNAKTDAIDAEMITRFAETKQPSPMTPPTPTQEALRALSRRQASLVTNLVQEKNAVQKVDNATVKRDIKSHIRLLEARIAKIEKELDKIITSDEESLAKRKRMESITGVGRAFSNAMLTEMPELGSLRDKQASALVGVAPFNKDSGKHKGHRIIMGGRGQLRRSLYMGAQSAARFNPVLSEFYNRLRGKGKSHHVAVIAVMRKLVCLLNRMMADPEFKPQG
jgi:transposase